MIIFLYSLFVILDILKCLKIIKKESLNAL